MRLLIIYITFVSISLTSLFPAVAQENEINQEALEKQLLARNHIIAAGEYVASDKDDLAKLELDSALALSPKDWVANALMGDIMTERKDFLHALLNYDKAILANNSEPRLYLKRAEIHIKLNNHPEYIIGDYDRAIALAVPNTLYLTKKANYYANSVNPSNFKTDYASAIYTIEEALALEPQNPHLLYLKSKYLLGNKQNLAALSEVNRAIVIEPTNDLFLAQRGKVNFEIARYKAALTDFNRAIKINDQNLEYFNNRGHSNFNLDKYAAAYDDYSSAIDLTIMEITSTKGSVSTNDRLNKKLRSLLLFRGMSLVQDNRPFDGCDDFKRAAQMGETKARNYMRKYCN